ncbi:myeloid differentiation primary response protein MyD88-like isoform X2 [Physella acuta]|uniref:myeloid differentiation primary response protein MyD88-like isoform X2 n=1 Tax=Physella acuta TaxID=109671 RepID=UPI0027DE54C2|nr:myeloid differentiation primary response protein MyD88-like isoform X2 [Physella acuta]
MAEGYMGPSHHDIPLTTLPETAFKEIEILLNKNCSPKNDLVPNWDGLAELIGFSSKEIWTFQQQKSPAGAMLKEWKNKPHLTPTVGRLVELLDKLGRPDILSLFKKQLGEIRSNNSKEISYHDVPLHALTYSLRKKLENYLDEEYLLVNNVSPNWGGLAELIGFDSNEIWMFDRQVSPTAALLKEWMKQSHLDPTVGRLLELLHRLGREDILTDFKQQIDNDVSKYITKQKEIKNPIQDSSVSSGLGEIVIPEFLSLQEVILGKKIVYDAFVCYNPYGECSKDIQFVKEMIQILENPPHNFKLFVPSRDDLAGLNKFPVDCEIISERCRHMIVVLSPNFLQSEICEFQSTFAQSLSPAARDKRLIPIKIEECKTPNILSIMACCDFTKKDLWQWSWDRVVKSIKKQLTEEDFQVESSSRSDAPYDDNVGRSSSALRSGSNTKTVSKESNHQTQVAESPNGRKSTHHPEEKKVKYATTCF